LPPRSDMQRKLSMTRFATPFSQFATVTDAADGDRIFRPSPMSSLNSREQPAPVQ
jgi:hypothetical protein